MQAHINLPDRNPSSSNNNNENNETEQSNSQPATSTSSNAESTSASTDENARPPDTPNVSQPSHVNISPFSEYCESKYGETNAYFNGCYLDLQ